METGARSWPSGSPPYRGSSRYSHHHRVRGHRRGRPGAGRHDRSGHPAGVRSQVDGAQPALPERPEQVITDTASYSDIVFGLFAICGYQFSPRIADIGDTRLWRIRATTGPRPSYGKFDELGQHTIKLEVIRREWEDMLRVAGSLTTGQGPRLRPDPDDVRRGPPHQLGGGLRPLWPHLQDAARPAIAARRVLPPGHQHPAQPHRGPQCLARRIFFGNLGELCQKYITGMEDQLGALGLGLNCVVWWNILCTDAAIRELETSGLVIPAEIRARLHPLQFDHINFNGRYPIARPDLSDGLRSLRDPTAGEEDC